MKVEIKKLPVSRKVLLEEATKCSTNLKDKPQLAEQGITEEYITDFKSDIITAGGFKSDKEIRKTKTALTVLVKAKRKACIRWFKRGENFLEKAFKIKSPQVAEFPDYQSSKNSNVLLLDDIKAASNILNKYLAELTAKGMPVTFLAEGATLSGELNALDLLMAASEDDFEEYTIQRNLALLKVYEEINEINRAGRIVYENDPAKLKSFESPWPSTGGVSNEEAAPPQEPAPPVN